MGGWGRGEKRSGISRHIEPLHQLSLEPVLPLDFSYMSQEVLIFKPVCKVFFDLKPRVLVYTFITLTPSLASHRIAQRSRKDSHYRFIKDSKAKGIELERSEARARHRGGQGASSGLHRRMNCLRKRAKQEAGAEKGLY